MANILFGITGSIAAYKAADIANNLTKRGHSVRVVMTGNAAEFVSPLTFSTLTKNPVYTDSFAKTADFDVEHIGLAKQTDVFVIAPATANIIAKLAAGIADDLLSTTALAVYAKPALICPAMNTAMYEHPITQRNIETLKALGYNISEPREAMLACGDLGKGALADSEIIISQIEELAKTSTDNLTQEF
jgi:phosphopantothenoylcysteine decarboxylase/phosphopantothenoylcysteine decarboxylase/phosphopantothenate--cysteine ligase